MSNVVTGKPEEMVYLTDNGRIVADRLDANCRLSCLVEAEYFYSQGRLSEGDESALYVYLRGRELKSHSMCIAAINTSRAGHGVDPIVPKIRAEELPS